MQSRFFHKENRRRDGDNLNASIKAAIDGLTKAGVYVDDHQVILHPPEQYVVKNYPRLELYVRVNGRAALPAEEKFAPETAIG